MMLISNRLLDHTDSPNEAAIVRGNLAWAYLMRARRSAGQRDLMNIFPDIWRALRAAPARFPWYIIKIFGIYNVPARRRGAVKRFFVRVVPGLSARW